MASLLKSALNLCKNVLFDCRNFASSSKTSTDLKKNTVCAVQNGVYGETAAVVIGLYKHPKGGEVSLTPTGERLQAVWGDNWMYRLLNTALPWPDKGEVRTFHGAHPVFTSLAIVGLGEQCAGYNVAEQIDEKKETVRQAVGLGVQQFHDLQIGRILVDGMEVPEAAAEGAALSAWNFQEFKTLKNRRNRPQRINLLGDCNASGWRIGLHKAAAQNFARHLQEMPYNRLTPQMFAQATIELLGKYDINIEVRMKTWVKLRNMNAFLAVSKASCAPIFLELFYEGCDPNICHVLLIGKGTTFNTGGLCVKNCSEMKHMRGDMAGAAAVVATIRAIAALKLPINVRGLIPLCPNMVGAMSYKPGDIFKAYNGKTILVEQTGCESLLMHADALCYAAEYNPKFILDIGTMTEDASAAFGQAGSIVFSNNDSLYETMRIASIHTGDRVWRFPLWNYFDQYLERPTSDLSNNVPLLIGGGPCKAAAFLSNFVPKGTDWMHIDIQNIYRTKGDDQSYLRKGMSGRPTRTLIEFLAQMSCRNKYSAKENHTC